MSLSIKKSQKKLTSFISWNALSYGSIVAISLISLPIYYQNLSREDFATISLIWSILAIGTTLDLGVGRALTRELSAISNEGPNNSSYQTIASSGLIASVVYSTLASIIIGFAASYYFELISHRYEVKSLDIMLIGFAAFSTLASNGVLAILDGLHLIRNASLIRIGSILCFMGGPAVYIVSHESPQLTAILSILALARSFQLIVCLTVANNHSVIVFSSASIDKIRQLFSLGKWLTLSNIASISITNSDRFIIGYFQNSTGLSNYVIASDLIQKGVGLLTIISTSIFPLVSRTGASIDQQKYLKTAAAINFTIGSLGIVFGVFFIQGFLKLWLNSDNVDEIVKLFQIMLVGWIASGFGQIYLANIHGAGDMRTPAIIHSIQAIIVIPIMLYSIYNHGVYGAASVWVIRAVIDALILKIISDKNK